MLSADIYGSFQASPVFNPEIQYYHSGRWHIWNVEIGKVIYQVGKSRIMSKYHKGVNFIICESNYTQDIFRTGKLDVALNPKFVFRNIQHTHEDDRSMNGPAGGTA